MHYSTLPSFDRDLARLPREHRTLFLTALREHVLPAVEAGAFRGASATWPKRLRIHRLTESPIYSLTWNFASPDGRATFQLEQAAGGGQPVLVWR